MPVFTFILPSAGKLFPLYFCLFVFYLSTATAAFHFYILYLIPRQNTVNYQFINHLTKRFAISFDFVIFVGC